MSRFNVNDKVLYRKGGDGDGISATVVRNKCLGVKDSIVIKIDETGELVSLLGQEFRQCVTLQ